MKKRLCVLLGSLALVGLTACGEEEQSALLSEMIKGKSTDEVVDMVSNKYSDPTFIEELSQKGMKAALDLDFEAKGTYSTSLDFDGTITYAPEQGAYLDLSYVMKIGALSTNQTYDAEYVKDTDRLYINYSDPTTNSVQKVYMSNMTNGEVSSTTGVPAFTLDTTQIKDILNNYKDSITFGVSNDGLEFKIIGNDNFNKVIENAVSKVVNVELLGVSFANSNVVLTIELDQNFYLKDIDLEFDTKFTFSGQETTVSADLGLDIQYGTYSYVGLEDKSTYKEVSNFPGIPGLN